MIYLIIYENRKSYFRFLFIHYFISHPQKGFFFHFGNLELFIILYFILLKWNRSFLYYTSIIFIRSKSIKTDIIRFFILFKLLFKISFHQNEKKYFGHLICSNFCTFISPTWFLIFYSMLYALIIFIIFIIFIIQKENMFNLTS